MILVLIIAIAVRFQLTVPVAAMEPAGPVRMLRRSWDLTRGSYWRLLGFLLIVLIVALVIQLVAQLLGGVLGRLMFGDISPWSAGALVVALIYLQKAAPSHEEVSVPSSNP